MEHGYFPRATVRNGGTSGGGQTGKNLLASIGAATGRDPLSGDPNHLLESMKQWNLDSFSSHIARGTATTVVRQFVIDSTPVGSRAEARGSEETVEQKIGATLNAFLRRSFELQHHVTVVRDPEAAVAAATWFNTTRDRLVRGFEAYLARREASSQGG